MVGAKSSTAESNEERDESLETLIERLIRFAGRSSFEALPFVSILFVCCLEARRFELGAIWLRAGALEFGEAKFRVTLVLVLLAAGDFDCDVGVISSPALIFFRAALI